ncbi:MAG: hypothetical protein ACI9SY_000002 [Candidatus Paceibacteria bacterium]|jgi:hypothetical protein
MPLDGDLNKYKSTAEKDPSAVFDDESLFENLEAVNDNEREFSLDSAEAIQSLFAYVEDTALDNWLDEHPGDWSGFSESESFQLLTELQHEAHILEEKIEVGEVSEVDAIEIQVLIDKLQANESLKDIAENSVESEQFDPNSYINDQFADHPYLIPSQRSPVYLLQREYKRALSEGATGDAEILAQQIKDHVDELVGNDQIPEEGNGTDLTLEKKGTELKPDNLDAAEEKVVVYPAANSLESLMQLHGEEVGRDLFESRQVVKNLRAETEKATVHPESVEGMSLDSDENISGVVTDLYGMRLPTSDDPYRFNAVTFRDGLEIAMRHDAERLSQLPEKLQLFSELQELLKDVPVDGITEETSKRLQELAQEINESDVVVNPIEPELVDQISEFSPQEVTPEERLKSDLAEYGIESLEPEMVEEAQTTPVSFAPSLVQESTVREAAKEEKEYERQVKKEIKTIEASANQNFLSRFVNKDTSPYEKLANDDFETVIMDTNLRYVNSFQRAAFIRNKQIDHTAFDRWMNLFSQLEDSGIETAGKTFKEVADQLVELQITERNTQST